MLCLFPPPAGDLRVHTAHRHHRPCRAHADHAWGNRVRPRPRPAAGRRIPPKSMSYPPMHSSRSRRVLRPRRAACRASRPLPALSPAEQTCSVASGLTTYDANAVAVIIGTGNCIAGSTTLNAVTGTTACELGCDAGYIVSSSTLTCAPNGNLATGSFGGATCMGSDPHPCSARDTRSERLAGRPQSRAGELM